MERQLSQMFPAPGDLPDEARVETIHQRQYLVGGELRRWEGPVEEVWSPIGFRSPEGFQRQLLGTLPSLSPEAALEALAAAEQAWDNGRGLWPTMSVEQRIGHVEDFIRGLKLKREAIVRLLMWEIGKTRADAGKEFDRSVDYLVDTIEALKDLDRASSRFQIEQGIVAQSRRAPLGVTLCMGPFNYPLNETFTTLFPALIMGNPVVFKPPKHGVLLYEPILELFQSCFPPGVINTVYGDGAKIIGPLMSSGKIEVLAFIGSAKVANILKKQHPAPHRLRCVLGLGAKNPAIVLADADLDLAIPECLTGALSFNGQRCTALKIFFVDRRIVEPFLEKLSAAIAALKCGMPWEKDVMLTPLPEPGKPAYFQAMVADAVAKGAQVVNPDGGLAQDTFFYPALLYPVNPEMQVYQVEQFGPVIPVVPFDAIYEPIDYIVHSEYGQQLSLFGTDPDALARLIDPLVNQVCRINLNSQCQRGPDSFPFAGRKGSAEGTLSISDALRCFSIRTLVAAKQTPLNQKIITEIVRGRKSHFLSSDFIF
ncbi:MAG TPA: NADP-dependent glyceraldehyde-3-phosphate dehydrogenase [Candidatus Obscuribacterales bacterium]